ncbi:secreted RxLR effector protein 161-like [Apium graveolens]|uniref:secreted RxLR effector protein 161-like n=1 Tax=Apium graveolens TaxID=4045 RepID=UPI003D7AE207
MRDCNSVKYPMEAKAQLHKEEGGKPVDSIQFKSIVSGLRYLVHTRPDIAYSVGVVSRYMEKPTVLHLEVVKRILKYVRKTLEYGLIYSRRVGNYILSGYADSDIDGSLDNRRSTSGMTLYLNKNLITWVSQKQSCVALSSCEVEFMAATAAACQVIWLKNLLRQITDMSLDPVNIFVDNTSAIDLTKNHVFHGRNKYIDIRYQLLETA